MSVNMLNHFDKYMKTMQNKYHMKRDAYKMCGFGTFQCDKEKKSEVHVTFCFVFAFHT